VTYDPKGCYFESNTLKFNVGNKNTGVCSGSDNCLCRIKAVVPKKYSLRKSGRCGYGQYITTYAECNAAAKELKLRDTSSSNDNQPKGVTYDPKGCYFESNTLKFNVGNKNTGGCSGSDNCLCRIKAVVW